MLSCDAILVRGRLRRKSALIHSPLVFAGHAAAETAQRRRVGRDDLERGGVENQRSRGPLCEHGLAGRDRTGSGPAPAHEIPRAEPKCGTPESSQGAEAECQMVHASSLHPSFESLAEGARARPCAAHSLRRAMATNERSRELRRASEARSKLLDLQGDSDLRHAGARPVTSQEAVTAAPRSIGSPEPSTITAFSPNITPRSALLKRNRLRAGAGSVERSPVC